jgi:phosphatidylglycerophosphate synthase
MRDWIKLESKMRHPLHVLGQKQAVLYAWLRITPNQLTVGRFVILGPMIAYAYAHGSYIGPVIGLLLLVLYTIIDYADGALALSTNQITDVGGWYDATYDFLLQCIMMGGAAYSVLREDAYGYGSWILVVAALLGQAALIHHTDMFGGLFNRREKFFAEYDELKPTLIQRIAIDSLTTRSGLAIIIFTFRYWVLLFTLWGRMDLLPLALAITLNLRCVIIHCVMAKTLGKKDSELWGLVRKYVMMNYEVTAI